MHITRSGVARFAVMASCLGSFVIGDANAGPASASRTDHQTAKQASGVPTLISEACVTYRHDWGNKTGVWNLFLEWPFVNGTSRVFVAIGEGTPAGKFLGDAAFALLDVAPRSGGVDIRVNIAAAGYPQVSVDYLVCNP